jgi:hypothetical protein
VDTTHQAATLTVEVRVDLLLKGGLVEVARANGDTKGNGLLLGLASHILVDGERRVDTTALTEEAADSTAGALRSAENDINVSGDIDLGDTLENGGEAVGEVEGLALDKLGLDGGPSLRLSGIGEQVHDDGTAGNGLIDVEEILSGDPAVLLGVLPGLAVLSDTNDDIEAVVAEVQTLAMALRAVANEGQGIVLEVLLQMMCQFCIPPAIREDSCDLPRASPGANQHAL